MTEAEALKRFIPILGRISTPGDRVKITQNILERIAGKQTCIMGVSHKHAGALAWPKEPIKALAFENALNAAVDAGEFASLLHRVDRRHFQIEELSAWPDCPPISPDSPLTFWLGDPAQDTTAPAPVVAALVEPDKAGPVEDGLLTKEIAITFDGVNEWNAERWRKNLSASKWLHPARTALGGAGGASSVWNPLTLAQLMHSKTKGDKAREKVLKAFNSRFTRNSALMPWREAFNEYFATHCARD